MSPGAFAAMSVHASRAAPARGGVWTWRRTPRATRREPCQDIAATAPGRLPRRRTVTSVHRLAQACVLAALVLAAALRALPAAAQAPGEGWLRGGTVPRGMHLVARRGSGLVPGGLVFAAAYLTAAIVGTA